MAITSARIARERKTLEAMIRIFCRDRHRKKDEICSDCAGLLAYAVTRLDKCPFGPKKPACANCTVHCYRPDMREQVRAVMRYAGPRMLCRHPVLAACHLIDSRRKAQALSSPKGGAANKP